MRKSFCIENTSDKILYINSLKLLIARNDAYDLSTIDPETLKKNQYILADWFENNLITAISQDEYLRIKKRIEMEKREKDRQYQERIRNEQQKISMNNTELEVSPTNLSEFQYADKGAKFAQIELSSRTMDAKQYGSAFNTAKQYVAEKNGTLSAKDFSAFIEGDVQKVAEINNGDTGRLESLYRTVARSTPTPQPAFSNETIVSVNMLSDFIDSGLQEQAVPVQEKAPISYEEVDYTK